MFSKRRGPHKRSSSNSTNAAAVPSSPASTTTAAAAEPPLVSPLQMTFDFGSFEVPPPLSSTTSDAPPSPFSPIAAEPPTRPKTSHGLPSSTFGVRGDSLRGNNGLQPPSLPPIPQVASRDNSMRSANSNASREQESAGLWGTWRARDGTDNTSVVSKKSAPKARLSFEHPIDMLPPLSRPTTPGGSGLPERPQTATGSSNHSTPKMESSLFPARSELPLLPQPSTSSEVMTRSFIDSRDKPYSQPPPRPFMMQGNHSSPSLLQPQAGSTSGRQLTPIYSSSKHFISPKPSMQNMSQKTNLSGSTARPSTQASSHTMNSNSPTITIGTPYQSTASTFPLPQHVMTRPKTQGATATVAGVSVPTHHTSSKPVAPPTEAKESKKKGRRLNPLSLLQRRRSNQGPNVVTEERQAQAQALARQRDVAQSGIYKPPPDFDPRIKGRVVHDFSAPRSSKRNTFDELNFSDEMQSPDNGQALSSPGYPPRNASLVNRGPLSDRSDRRSTHTPVFMEHLGENPEASRRISSLQAENLENRDFLQRASKHSSTASYSQESAILPPFARRSQILDPMQASLYKDDDSKRSSDPSSEKERDSTLSSISEVSPITARSSSHHVDVRQSMSPVSPSSPGKGYRPVSETSSQTGSQDSGKRPVSQLTKTSSQERHQKSVSELTARPYSVVLAPPVINTIAEGSVESSPVDGNSNYSPQVLTRGLSFQRSANSSPGPDALQPAGTHTPGRGGDSSASPSLLERTAGIPTPEGTPEPDLVEPIQFKPNKDQPKLVEKRISAIGHARKSSGGPKHHASNASRFSFQQGSESALQEQALEEKHRNMRKSQMTDSTPSGPTPDDDDDDDFDADAMDDMDEMEMEAAHLGDPEQPVEAVALQAQSGRYLQQARQALHQDAYSDDGSVYDDDIPEVTNEEDVPYPDHPAFRTHSALGNYSHSERNSYALGGQDGYWRGSTIDHYMRDSYLVPAHSRMQSQASNVTADTEHLTPTDAILGTNRFSRPRSKQPSAAVDTLNASPRADKPSAPPRDSGNSEQSRIASGMTFTQPGNESVSEDELAKGDDTTADAARGHVISGMSYSTVNTNDAQSPLKHFEANPFYMHTQAAHFPSNAGEDSDSPPFRYRDSQISERTRVPSALSLSTTSTVGQPEQTHLTDVEGHQSVERNDKTISLASPVGASEDLEETSQHEDGYETDVLSLASPTKSIQSQAAGEESLSGDEVSLASPPRQAFGHSHSHSIDAISLASPTRDLGHHDRERNNSGGGISLASPRQGLEKDEELERKPSKGSPDSDGRRNGSVRAFGLRSPPQSRLGHRSTESGMGFEDFVQSGFNSPSAPEHRVLSPVTPPAIGHGDAPNNSFSSSSKASSPRTVSTGLGLTMFPGFDFDDQPPMPTVQPQPAKGPSVPAAAATQTPSSSQRAQYRAADLLGSPKSSASSPRTVSTAMGMSMFGGFEFEDSPAPLPDLPNKAKHNNTSSAESVVSPKNSAFTHEKSASVQQPGSTTPADQRFIRPNSPGQSDRIFSTATGISSFGGFEFDEGPGSVHSNQRDTSSARQSAHENATQSAPRGQWGGIQKHTSPLSSPAQVVVPSYHVSSDSQGTHLAKGPTSIDMSAGESINPNLRYTRPSIPYADDDDMYFDDGNFEQDISGSHGASFDENAFDDDAFLSRPGLVNRYQHQRDNSGLTVRSMASDGPYPSFAMPNAARASARYSQMALEDIALYDQSDPGRLQRNPSEDAKRLGMDPRVPPVPVPESNTEAFSRMQQSLQGYHAALADAATIAAANGRFNRAPSTSTAHGLTVQPQTLLLPDDRSIGDDKSVYSAGEDGGEIAMPHGNHRLNGSSNGNLDRSDTTGSHLTHLTTYSPPKMSFDFGFNQVQQSDDDYDGFGNEDDLVAAANAEALALDDEGFYGQEFDFYRRPRANSGDLEAVNGGYFGEDGDDGLTRNKSLREPNLTPITERSEFSTRNSFVGFGNGGFGPASAGPYGPHSPALARMPVTPFIESEITSFDELRRLKANAFGGGGSQSGSLKSNSNRSSSQSLQNAFSPTAGHRPGQNYFGGVPMQFGYSTDSSNSSNPNSGHPITMGGQHGFNFQDSPQSAGSSQGMPFSMDVDATPKRNTNSQQEPTTARKIPPAPRESSSSAQGHSRKGSGADSVTYVREPDPEGSGKPRWVLERRRTSEQGQLELVGREWVQGGWI